MPVLQPGLSQGKGTRAQRDHGGFCPGMDRFKNIMKMGEETRGVSRPGADPCSEL